MANNKTGFIYYSVDTDRYQDLRIKKLKKNYGRDGVAIYDYILCEIYRVKGCFIMWDESTAFDVAEYWEVRESLVDEIINYCCHVGLFSKELRENGNLLSSKSIVTRYLDWSKKAKRSMVVLPKQLSKLLEESEIIQEESDIIPEEYGHSPGSLPQSKVKESKVKESKGDDTRPDLSKSNLFRQPVIPTIEKVTEVFVRQGGTEEMAQKFFDKNQGTGWFYNNSPITSFSNLVPGFISSWKKNDENGKKHGDRKNSKSAGASELASQLEAKINGLRNNGPGDEVQG